MNKQFLIAVQSLDVPDKLRGHALREALSDATAAAKVLRQKLVREHQRVTDTLRLAQQARLGNRSATEIDMDEVPYHHDPVNEDYGYETVSEWEDEDGFTDEEDLDDSDDDVEDSDDDVEDSDDEDHDDTVEDGYDTVEDGYDTVEGSDDEDSDDEDSDDENTVSESEIRPPTPPVSRRPKLQRNPRDLTEVFGQTLDQTIHHLLGMTSGPRVPTRAPREVAHPTPPADPTD